MIFIGGINDKRVGLGQLRSVMCKHCRQTHTMDLFKSYYFFHFFFLPLWKWKLNYDVKCEGCQTIMRIPNHLGKTWEQGEDLKLTLWDLEIIKEGASLEQQCKHYHEMLPLTYQYCPHCGKKVRERNDLDV